MVVRVSCVCAAAVVVLLALYTPALAQTFSADTSLFMPSEEHKHARTWMAFGSSKAIWGADTVPEVQKALARIANTIVKYEPVIMVCNSADVSRGKELLSSDVQIVEHPLDDLWMRDTGAVFSYTCTGYSSSQECAAAGSDASRTLNAVGFNFNGWGNKQTHANDAKIAEWMAEYTGATFKRSWLVMEGGGIEVDGEGTALATESCILNSNRNPAGTTKAEVEEELFNVLGIEKVIWSKGVKGKDITDAHIDFYARFAAPGVVIAARENDPNMFDYAVTRQVIADLQAATDARGRKLRVIIIDNPSTIRSAWESNDFAASYINYYVANGAVIVSEFGDAAADAAAKAALASAYPDHVIEMINIDAIAYGGGGIHCSTMQQPVGVFANTPKRNESSGATPSSSSHAGVLALACIAVVLALL